MKGLRMREGQEIEIEPEHARYIWVRGGLSKPVGMNIPVDHPRFSSRAGGEGIFIIRTLDCFTRIK